MSKYTYCVITKVPDPTKGEAGNLCSSMLAMPPEYMESDVYLVKDYSGDKADIKPVAYTDFPLVKWPTGEGQLMTPVFAVGEICILDAETGREVGWPQRKPGKWFIEYEQFSDLDDAVKRSREVTADVQTL